MNNLNYDATEVINRIFSLYPTMKMEDLVEEYLEDDRNYEIRQVEYLGPNEDRGMLCSMLDKNGTEFYVTFSDLFIGPDENNLIMDFTWINLLDKKLRHKSPKEANDYLISVNETIDNLEADKQAKIKKKEIILMRNKLQAISAGKYSKTNPVLSECQRLILYLRQNV